MAERVAAEPPRALGGHVLKNIFANVKSAGPEMEGYAGETSI